MQRQLRLVSKCTQQETYFRKANDYGIVERACRRFLDRENFVSSCLVLSRLVSSALSWIYLSVHRVTRHACRIKHWWEGTRMWASISVLLVRMRCRNCRLCRNGYREVNWSWVICCGVFRQFWSYTRWNLASSCGNRKRVAGENATTLYRYFRHHSLFRNRTARSAIFN